MLPELTRAFDLGPPARRGRIDLDDAWLSEWADAVAAAVASTSLAGHRAAMVGWARTSLTWGAVAGMWADEFDSALAAGGR